MLCQLPGAPIVARVGVRRVRRDIFVSLSRSFYKLMIIWFWPTRLRMMHLIKDG